MKRSTKILLIMVSCAIVALGFGFYVMKSRTSPFPTNQANNDSAQNQTPPPTPPTPPVEDKPVTVPTTGWKVYTNDKHGFTVQYPSNLKAGSISENSVLGTFQVPVRGYHIGPLVLVVLKDAEIKKDAQELFNGVYSAAQKPPAQSSEGPTVECKLDKVTNSNVVEIKSVSCTGEGGPAKYAYITGKSYDIFVDGYSKGYGNADNGNLTNDAEYVTILSTFIFTADVQASATITTSTTPTSSTTTPPPPVTAPSIQSFTITADDSSATPSEITVKKDAIVQITFNVGVNTYYGGLDFKSSVVNSGTVNAGQSKTISFKATQSFEFTPYWPASNVAKDYRIKVMVN